MDASAVVAVEPLHLVPGRGAHGPQYRPVRLRREDPLCRHDGSPGPADLRNADNADQWHSRVAHDRGGDLGATDCALALRAVLVVRGPVLLKQRFDARARSAAPPRGRCARSLERLVHVNQARRHLSGVAAVPSVRCLSILSSEEDHRQEQCAREFHAEAAIPPTRQQQALLKRRRRIVSSTPEDFRVGRCACSEIGGQTAGWLSGALV
eukprot:scaffold7340_cov266-Pinguiococcus_pyrenoidosus.AAC.65